MWTKELPTGIINETKEPLSCRTLLSLEMQTVLLGHVSVQTTEVYARADSKAKREALEKAYADIGLTKPTAQTSWERDPKLKAFLKSLG